MNGPHFLPLALLATLRALADACEDCDVANTTMTDEDECAREQRQLLWCALPGGAWRSAAAELRTMADTVEALVRERDRLARVLAPEFAAPPQVPDADAVAKYGKFWWRGDVVVSVSTVHGVLRWTQPGYDWADYLNPADDWGGPVGARRRSVLPVAP